jgi:putative glycosyl hydrolase-like family 15 (GHL15) protein
VRRPSYRKEHQLKILRLTASVLAGLAVLSSAPPALAQPAEAGSVRFTKAAEASFDRFTKSPTSAEQTWMRDHYWRMRAYAPYFDSRLSWYGDAWAYQDLYAIYTDSDVVTRHPDWILKDAVGHKLYIPFGCSGGECPQYAADFGNPEFRSWWIQSAAEKLAKGYRGLFIDDVNMDFRIGNGSGSFTAPRDPRTGEAMTERDWRRYVAEFTQQIRQAFPAKELVHNAIWYAGCGAAAGSCWADPQVRRQLLSADLIELERGVNDAGITGGEGRWGYETFMSRIDWLHSHSKGVIFDSSASGDGAREYGLASYLLVSNGSDGLGNGPGGSPDDWWKGYDVRLGAPKGPRYASSGLLRRDFEHGFVLVNQPGGSTRTVDLPAGATGPAGAARSSATLSGGQGAVIVTGTPGAGPQPTKTETVVQPTPHPVAPSPVHVARRRAQPKRRLPRAVLVRGLVRRALAGRVRIRLQHRTARGWVQFRGARVAMQRGHFRRLFRSLPAGRYRVRAAYLGSARATVSYSHLRRFRIQRRY